MAKTKSKIIPKAQTKSNDVAKNDANGKATTDSTPKVPNYLHTINTPIHNIPKEKIGLVFRKGVGTYFDWYYDYDNYPELHKVKNFHEWQKLKISQRAKK